MSQKRIADRKARNLELGRQDRLNRCDECRRAFTETKQVIQSFAVPGRYCSEECFDTARKRQA